MLRIPIDLAQSIAIPDEETGECRINISVSLCLKLARGKAPLLDDKGLLPTFTLMNEPVPIVITQSPGLNAHSAITDDCESPIFSFNNELSVK